VYFKRPEGRLGVPRGLVDAVRRPRSRWPVLPFPVFLIDHPTEGPFLVDTGPSPRMVDDARADLGRVGAALLSVRMGPDETAAARVRALGHDPASIERVVMTHLHYDHLGGAEQFPNAEFVATMAELDDPPDARKGTYAHHRRAVRRWRTIDGPWEPHGPFARTFDLFGDGSVRLVSTPGHTPGHVSLLLRLRDDRPGLIVGDAAYDRRAIDERNVPLLCPDVDAYLDSLDQLRAFVAQTPEAIVVCGHDPERWERDSAALAAA
jgi:glyoxylase-like metal-dependent hydrolase (beta-lactamase superfamily II)